MNLKTGLHSPELLRKEETSKNIQSQSPALHQLPIFSNNIA